MTGHIELNMVNTVRKLFSRVKEIYEEEGLLATIKRIFVFVMPYRNETYYVYERTLRDENEADYLPKIQNVTHRIIETVQQLDELSTEVSNSSQIDIKQFRYRLKKGAILSLLLINREVASVSWAAFDKKAKKSFDRPPYKVDFANREVCGGGTWVNPKYRGQRLHIYTLHKKEEYLVRRGATKDIYIVSVDNVISQRTSITRGSEIITKAHYIRIFGLQFWREKPHKSTNEEG